MSTIKANVIGVSALTYNLNHRFIEAITDRTQMRELPKSNPGSFVPGNQLTFEICHEDFVDCSTAAIRFTVSVTDPANDRLACALDLFDHVITNYNGVNLEDHRYASAWSNNMVAREASQTWLKNEGLALLGYYGPEYAPAVMRPAAHDNTRVYIVPLCLIAPFWGNEHCLPIVGNKVTIELGLNNQIPLVLSAMGDEKDSYSISNVQLLYDKVTVADKSRKEIIDAFNSNSGFLIPYLSYLTNEKQVTATTDHSLRVDWQCANALSLHILRRPQVERGDAKENCRSQTYPLDTFESCEVKCGSKHFTPPRGIQGLTELWMNGEKTHLGFCNLLGSGYLNWKNFSQPSAGHPTVGGKTDADTAVYTMTPISINLERVEEEDNGVMNSGFNQKEQAPYFDVTIRTTQNLNATDKWLTNVVHKRALKFANHQVTVEK